MTSSSCRLTHALLLTILLPPLRGYDWEEYAQQVDDNSVVGRSQQLINTLKQRGAAYRHRHLLVPFGDDFKFRQAELQFSNMGRIVRYIQEHTAELGVWAQFSTLSDYFAGAQREGQFPSLQGDFMPYADNEQSYWTVGTSHILFPRITRPRAWRGVRAHQSLALTLCLRATTPPDLS